MYDAIDIAKYIINYGCKKKEYAYSLKIQAILYLLWMEYFNQTGERLFRQAICSWRIGPVVPDVYYKFCAYGGARILHEYKVDINLKDTEVLDKVMDNCYSLSTPTILKEEKKPGSPWELTYNGGHGDRYQIPFSLLENSNYAQLYSKNTLQK